ncbi:ABC transporter permease [Nocardioides endophyticus]|uniref:ABC transporter permease n=1 Tax=Nocardioides endophyticus TaxID=1353775 RepID=A0ABP8Z656_9ACTN
MIALLRGELAKAVTTRTFWAFLLGNAAFAALNAVLVGAASGTLDSVPEKQEAISSLPLLVLVWGLVGVAGEHRHRTAAPSALVARHGRGTLLAMRIGAYGLTGVALGVVVSVVGVAVALPLLAAQPGPDLSAAQVSDVVAGNLVAAALSVTLGAAIGALLRSQVLGVVAVLVVGFAVVPLISSVNEGAANLTPFGASAVLTGATHDTTITAYAAAWILVGWTVALTTATVLVERARDLA